jgi:hypothetical protein
VSQAAGSDIGRRHHQDLGRSAVAGNRRPAEIGMVDAIAQRIRTDLDDHATRHDLTVVRAGRRRH